MTALAAVMVVGCESGGSIGNRPPHRVFGLALPGNLKVYAPRSVERYLGAEDGTNEGEYLEAPLDEYQDVEDWLLARYPDGKKLGALFACDKTDPPSFPGAKFVRVWVNHETREITALMVKKDDSLDITDAWVLRYVPKPGASGDGVDLPICAAEPAV